MKKSCVILSAYLLLQTGLAFAAQGQPRSIESFLSSAKIGPSVLRLFLSPSLSPSPDMATAKHVPILVLLKSQPDLSRIDDHLPKQTRGRLVYELLRKTALGTQGALIEFLKSRNVEFRPFHIQNMIAVYGATPELVQALAARGDVGKIIGNTPVHYSEPDATLRLKQLLEKSQASATWALGDRPGDNIAAVGAVRVHEELKITGENIVIAGQDTGVDWKHPALRAHYRGYAVAPDGLPRISHDFNWHDSIHKPFDPDTERKNICGYELAAPCDDDKHGTHTMGTMVGDDGGDHKIGMAPGAKWMACRNMDAGVGTPASYIECFEYFLAPYANGKNPQIDGKPDLSPHIINNSWGCPPDEGCEGGEMIASLTALAKAGVMVVASAGNDGPDCATINAPPASDSELTLSVGSVDHRNWTIESYSSRGPSKFDGKVGPDVTAPGGRIYSCVPGGGYAQDEWSGTSMAGPHVAGEIALLWSAKPELIGKIPATVNRVRATATPKTTTQSCGGVAGSAVPNNTYGYGIIDAYQAITAKTVTGEN